MNSFLLIQAMSKLFFTLGLAYLIYIFASKEKKNLKELGKALAWVLVILAIISYLGTTMFFGGAYKGRRMRPCPIFGRPFAVL